MNTKDFFGILLMAMFAVVGLTACSNDDEPKDSVKEIRMQISAETGVMYAWGDDKKENPIECMLVMSEDNPGVWEPLGFGKIEGFTYERGHEYYLSVRRTILANPPADASDRTYSLIRILEDRVVTEPEVPVDEEITSEEDIEYHDLCPFEKYATSKGYIVDANGKIFYDDGYGSSLPSYDNARIWLEDVLDKGDPNWVKFESVPYMAMYSFVLSPFTDDIRLVSNGSHGPMFKDVVPEDEFTRIQSMQSGEEVRYALILANVYKKGLQKLEFTIKKQ
ncbi:hypothetical protein B5F34_04570 [Mediterranea sp. An20]|uniref:DUF4377 domain-containing protein n=1 Tax=Mediterranea sp. An20 TaxID=1965586 RepID=UPI000B565CDA|nr:DUF4377 domain-containing protein [Mediterranea sp. An20]OUP10685.1 hypothetical protein B5F34_04570 [Mediterranea sp. An20]